MKLVIGFVTGGILAAAAVPALAGHGPAMAPQAAVRPEPLALILDRGGATVVASLSTRDWHDPQVLQSTTLAEMPTPRPAPPTVAWAGQEPATAQPFASFSPPTQVERAPLQLDAGGTIEAQLRAWASHAGWTMVWDLPQDWVVPARTTFDGDFMTAAKGVIETLAAAGADVRADVYTKNRTFVVHQARAGQ